MCDANLSYSCELQTIVGILELSISYSYFLGRNWNTVRIKHLKKLLVKKIISSLIRLRSLPPSLHREDFDYLRNVDIKETYRMPIKQAKVRLLESFPAKFTSNGTDMFVGFYPQTVNFGMVLLLGQGKGSTQFFD